MNSTSGSPGAPASSLPTVQSSTEIVAAIDCGQSSTKARVIRADADPIAIELPAIRTDIPVVPQLADFVKEIVATTPIHAVALGVSGLTDDDHATDLLPLVQPLGITRVVLAHDSITSYLGALGADPGVVVACGTGVVTLAVGVDRTARVDGWGNIMGDAGSGFWIGRAGLDAGMRAFDGRDAYGRASTAMLDVIRTDFGDPATAYIELQADPQRIQRVASYARVVLDLATGDDVACAQIADQAALELAISASSGLKEVGKTTNALASTVGGIFGSRVLSESFQRYLNELAPGVRLVTPLGIGIDGAQVLASLPAEHPLRASFTEASV